MVAAVTVYHDSQAVNPVITKSLEPNKFRLDFLKTGNKIITKGSYAEENNISNISICKCRVPEMTGVKYTS